MTNFGIKINNARAIAYKLRKGVANGGIHTDGLALYLEGVAVALEESQKELEKARQILLDIHANIYLDDYGDMIEEFLNRTA